MKARFAQQALMPNTTDVATMRKAVMALASLSLLAVVIGMLWTASENHNSTAMDVPSELSRAHGEYAIGSGDAKRSAVDDAKSIGAGVDATLAASVTAETGSICLEVFTLDEVPVSGIRIELSVPESLRSQHSGWSSIPDGKVLTEGLSDAEGRCIFPNLPPDESYRLIAHADVPLFFEAQLSPLSAVRGSSEIMKVSLGRSSTPQDLAGANRSGPVPVLANTITRTRLLVARGATIRGLVVGRDWDEVTVDLKRLYRGVRSTFARSRQMEFEFLRVVPVGTIDIQFQARHGSSYFFGLSPPLSFTDGSLLDVALEPWDPMSSIELLLRTAEPAADAPGVAVTFSREDPPQMTSDIVLKVDQPVRIHGMFRARILGVQMYPAHPDWRHPDTTDVLGLQQGCIVGPQHEIVLRRK